MLNDLSVIMDLAMIAINVPGIASMIQSLILNFIYLDILQTSMWLYPYLNSVDIDDQGVQQTDYSMSLYLSNSGFSSMVMIKNLGSTLIYVGLYVLMMLVHLFL
jgi:hypothetical protein